jgi:acetyl esterase/lipase
MPGAIVDPELVALLDQMPLLELTDELLRPLREGAATLFAQFDGETDPGADVQTHSITRKDVGTDIRVIVIKPRSATGELPALLHIHGGGYVFGTADMRIARLTRLAIQVNCIIASVEYRLAPETVFPGAIDDCFSAFEWIHKNASSLGVDANRIGVTGESAGGGLAAALALLVRDREAHPLICQALIYPMLDDRTAKRPPASAYIGNHVWTRSANLFGWTALLGREPGGADVSPYASAARAETLVNLPLTFIAVGALDLFLDEDLEYARRLVHAGVPTEMHVYPGAFHGFDLAADAKVSSNLWRDYVVALRRVLGTFN